MTGPSPEADPVPTNTERSPRRGMCAAVLSLEAITLGLTTPVMITIADVPTAAEAGVKNLEVYSWQAVVAPKGLPPAVRTKAHDAMAAALNDPAVKQQFTTIGLEVVANTPEQFAEFQRKEFDRWKEVITAGKITAD